MAIANGFSPGAADSALVSVIIPARNAEATLDRTLAAVEAQDVDFDFEVIVVDDGSQDRTAEVAGNHAPLVKTVQNDSSQGPGAARNRGVTHACGRFLAFTDADCFPERDWLARGVQALQEADLVQGAVIPDPSAPRMPFERTLLVDRAGGFYQTADLLVRHETFEAVGGFKDWSLDQPLERLLGPRRRRRFRKRTPAGEDALFGWMALRMGARIRFAPDVRVHHAVFPSTVAGVMADRWHWTQDMPGLVRLVPELRSAALHHRWFFSRWTMEFDVAVAATLAAWITRRGAWLALTIPYLQGRARDAGQWGWRNAPVVALGTAAADAATLAGLIVGSLTWRRLVL